MPIDISKNPARPRGRGKGDMTPSPVAVSTRYERKKKPKLGPQRGERNTQAKLNRKLADCILIMHEEYGVGYKRLKQFLWDWHGVAVSIACIRQVCNYERWLEPIEIWD